MNNPFGLGDFTEKDPFELTTSRRHIRTGFNSFVNRHPHFLVYIRRNLKYPHGDCLLTDTMSPTPECSVCFGTGYAVQYEKHKCRRVWVAKTSDEEVSIPGILSKYQVIVYTPRYYYPKTQDLYIEVEWDRPISEIETYGRPTSVVAIHRVDAIATMMEDEVSYFAVGVEPFNMNQTQAELWLQTIQKTWTEKVVV